MSILKCKMCGGTLTINDDSGIATCEYCGTKQTISKTTDDVISNLYNRANNLRLKNEFDKALSVYEKIVEQDDSEAEAHWGIVLCKYGIEYVDDPNTGKKVPTCHRTSFDSIKNDIDYQAAIDYSSSEQQTLYEEEAREIDRLQKEILSIAKNEKPFDVFICYKETDESGKRTVDSVLANDIYYQLTQDGYKVFYAAITLEDKLGQEYEPYIFSALNSAKVMIVIGTKSEYFNAVWVKNEWSRFFSLMKKDRTKTLIPCYRDMNAYDLPEEFAHLQAQDMSKIGFINDIIRGIKKILVVENQQPASTTNTISDSKPEKSSTVERAYIFLEDGDFISAEQYFERALDENPKNPDAYLGKVLVKNKIMKPDVLSKLETRFFNDDNYEKALRFSSGEQLKTIQSYKDKWHEKKYNDYIDLFHKATTLEEFASVKNLFSNLNYKDSIEKVGECEKKIEEFKRLQKAHYTLDLIQYSKWGDDLYLINGVLSFARDFAEKDSKFNNLLIKAENALKEFISKKKTEIETMINEIDQKNSILISDISKKNEINDLKEYIKNKINSIHNESKTLENELSTLGIFDGKRKKEIQSQIESNKTKIKSFNDLNVLITQLSDTEQKIDTIRFDETNNYGNLITRLEFKNTEVGSTVSFGTYKQKDKSKNDAIEWKVLDKTNNKILLISKYALDCKPYNEINASVTWETCSLRKWLNKIFYNMAFSNNEKQFIATTPIKADNKTKNSASDKVFLLSIDEVKQYLYPDYARKCKATKYAYENGAHTEIKNGNCWWWLKSSGSASSKAPYVYDTGGIMIMSFGPSVDSSYYAVRPALWINLESSNY